jgi:hypothetical protein
VLDLTQRGERVPHHVEYTREVCRCVPKTFLEALDLEAKSREWNILGGSTRSVRGRRGVVYIGFNIWRKNVST